MFDLHQKFTHPLILEDIKVLPIHDQWMVQVSCDGAHGQVLVIPNAQIFLPILENKVIPFFLGKDARDLETLVDEVERFASNHKLGLPVWTMVSFVEIAIWDMLGKIKNVPIYELVGTKQRDSISLYMSSMRRDTTPEEEIEWVGKRVHETGVNAVKLKVGGRVSNDVDVYPGRSENLVKQAREYWGEDFTIYVDGNSSYSIAGALELGKVLMDNGIAWFEEPCHFLHYEETKAVTDALDMPVAGGEQDTCLYRFEWMAHNRAVDILQPDVFYCGGITRSGVST